MRHFLGNVATYTIAGLLFLGAVLFAWLRSQQVVVTGEKTLMAGIAPQPARGFDWKEIGEASYARNCQNCHGNMGKGWDQYPAIAHTSQLFAQPGGRDYIIDLHLYGLTSNRWRAPMPPMGHLTNIELAATLNHVLTNYGNQDDLPSKVTLYDPADIEARRATRQKPAEVNQLRPQLPSQPERQR